MMTIFCVKSALPSENLLHVFTPSMRVIIDFCLHFRLGELRIILESTKRLLGDNERIKWNEYYDDDLYDDYDYDDDYYY